MQLIGSLAPYQWFGYLKDFVYDDNWTKEKYEVYKVFNMLPGISNYMNYLLDVRADQEYMNRNQLDWSDIHDPRKLSQTSSSSAFVHGGINFVSDNIKRLYK